MADEKPVCSKCGGERVPMKKGKGGRLWILGCPTCTGKPPEAKKDDKPAVGKPVREEKKGHWLDGYFE